VQALGKEMDAVAVEYDIFAVGKTWLLDLIDSHKQ